MVSSRIRASSRLVALLVSFSFSLSFSSVALADASTEDRARARALMDEGDRFVSAKSYVDALDRYQRADEIMHVPTTGIEVARAHAALGHFVAARETALAVARLARQPGEPAVWEEARTEAAVLAGTYADQIGAIVFDAGSTDGAVVTVDGMIVDVTSGVPLPADPGPHAVRIAVSGAPPSLRTITVEPGKTAHVSLALASASSPYHVPMLAGFGAAGLGLVTGTLFGAVSLSKASAAKSACSGGHCPPRAQGDIDGANGFGLASDIGFGVALAGAALGGFSLYMEQRGKEPRPATTSGLRARPFIGLFRIGIAGELP